MTLVLGKHDEREIYRARYNDLRDGLRCVAGIWISKEELRNCIFFGFRALTASIVTVGVANERRRRQKQQMETL